MSQATTSLLPSSALRQWTSVSRYRNLFCVAGEYVCLFLVHVANYLVITRHDLWGLPAWTPLLSGLLTVILTGCLMHRIGLIGPEASHHLH